MNSFSKKQHENLSAFSVIWRSGVWCSAKETEKKETGERQRPPMDSETLRIRAPSQRLAEGRKP